VLPGFEWVGARGSLGVRPGLRRGGEPCATPLCTSICWA
jgi:hypothetical protein